jgi:hypothetical protein
MSGLPTVDEARAMFRQLAKAEGPPRALIELLVDQCLNFLETVQVMSDLPTLGLPSGYRLALLITDDRMRASAQFAETVAVNRGVAVKTFDRRDEALRWLGA